MTVNVYIANWWIMPALNEHTEMRKWLTENTGSKWCNWVEKTYYSVKVLGITFYDEQDAVAFKLRFRL